MALEVKFQKRLLDSQMNVEDAISNAHRVQIAYDAAIKREQHFVGVKDGMKQMGILYEKLMLRQNMNARWADERGQHDVETQYDCPLAVSNQGNLLEELQNREDQS